MKRVRYLKIENEIYFDENIIKNKLIDCDLSWVNDAEIENAVLEIKDNELYWYGGKWYFGVWKSGVFVDGIIYYADWEDGIFVNGVIKDIVWKKGTLMNADSKDGEFLGGDIRKK
jgi:hypothetical protein